MPFEPEKLGVGWRIEGPTIEGRIIRGGILGEVPGRERSFSVRCLLKEYVLGYDFRSFEA